MYTVYGVHCTPIEGRYMITLAVWSDSSVNVDITCSAGGSGESTREIVVAGGIALQITGRISARLGRSMGLA